MRGSLENDVTPCVGGQRKKRFPGRWSLRHLIYSSPILNRRRSQNSSGSSKSHRNHAGSGGKDTPDGRFGSSSKDIPSAGGGGGGGGAHHVEIHQATSRTSVFTTSTKSGEVALSMECPLCFAELAIEEFRELSGCGHRACLQCLQQYLKVEITESRVCISCPECLEPMHPNEIRSIIDEPALYGKYEDFMVRRVLAVDPDTRWCPAPDCGFAVIASECASCPKLKCERPGCDSYFCYHCKAEWHPNQTCDAARAQRSPNIRSSSITYSQDSQHRDDIKPCPRCQVLIVKMDDGSCNHMMCAVCGAEFCWLCMKEISDLHYLSPSGCTFWGKKPWSRKKKILWQLGTLVGAPVGIALVAGITVPAMIIGIPVWVGRKLYTRYKTANKHKRNAAIVGGVVASVMISPILAGLAVGIGVPILLFYVYGVVPVSLCRSGGCGGSSTSDDATVVNGGAGATGGSTGGSGRRSSAGGDNTSMDAVSAKIAPSIGEASLSMASGSQVLLREADRDSASTVALAGSVGATSVGGGSGGCHSHHHQHHHHHHHGNRLEVQADLASASQRFSMSSLTESADDGGASTRALAGSMLNYKTNGSDSCSCVTAEDCTSERVRFDDNVSFIAEKTSIGSSCSFRARCATSVKPTLCRSDHAFSDTLSNDSIYIDMAPSCAAATAAASSSSSSGGESGQQQEKTATTQLRKSQAAILRSQFFYSSLGGGEPSSAGHLHHHQTTKSLDDKTIIEVSNETLDKQQHHHFQSSVPLIPQPLPPLAVSKATSMVLESSKL